MEKLIKITKPSGEESFKLLSAFKVNEKEFIVLDSNLKDPNGNVITFISRINGDNLEYVDGEDWNLVRDTLISIVKNTATVEFIDVKDSYQASENVGHTLALKEAHIEAVVTSYSVVGKDVETPVVEEAVTEPPVLENQEVTPVETTEPQSVINDIPEVNVVPEANASVLENSINNVDMTGPIDVAQMAQGVVQDSPIMDAPQEVADIQPVMDINPVIKEQPVMENSIEEPSQEVVENSTSISNDINEIEEIKNNIIALCDKLKEKEEMINAKLEVANKAYENAQNVMNSAPQDDVANTNEEVINIQDYQPANEQELQKTLVA